MPPTMTDGRSERVGLTHARVSLLGGFRLDVADLPVMLPIHASRVLAYLCLDRMTRPACTRHQLAERLWPEVPTDRAHASLRTALWRIRRASRYLIRVERERVLLDDRVDVDIHRGRVQAARLLSDDPELLPADTEVTTLVGDLLPGWDEDWLLLERERVRELQIHALEALARRLCRLGRYTEAIDVAYAVIEAEPLRESGHVTLIDVHLAEGNVAQAHRQLERYANLLYEELGLTPSPTLIAHVGRPSPRPPGSSLRQRRAPPRQHYADRRTAGG